MKLNWKLFILNIISVGIGFMLTNTSKSEYEFFYIIVVTCFVGWLLPYMGLILSGILFIFSGYKTINILNLIANSLNIIVSIIIVTLGIYGSGLNDVASLIGGHIYMLLITIFNEICLIKKIVKCQQIIKQRNENYKNY